LSNNISAKQINKGLLGITHQGSSFFPALLNATSQSPSSLETNGLKSKLKPLPYQNQASQELAQKVQNNSENIHLLSIKLP
jgi:hypothetical protein